MKKANLMLILCTIIVIAIPLVQSVWEGRNGVEEWYKELPLKTQKVTRLHFYLHDTVAAYPVFSSSITSTNLNNFGIGIMFDNPMTVGPELESLTIGKGQGLAGSASLDDPRFLTIINFVFTQGKFNGSTLQVYGVNSLLNEVREVSIVGGTGVFRLARGTAYFGNATASIREYDMVVLHY